MLCEIEQFYTFCEIKKLSNSENPTAFKICFWKVDSLLQNKENKVSLIFLFRYHFFSRFLPQQRYFIRITRCEKIESTASENKKVLYSDIFGYHNGRKALHNNVAMLRLGKKLCPSFRLRELLLRSFLLLLSLTLDSARKE